MEKTILQLDAFYSKQPIFCILRSKSERYLMYDLKFTKLERKIVLCNWSLSLEVERFAVDGDDERRVVLKVSRYVWICLSIHTSISPSIL